MASPHADVLGDGPKNRPRKSEDDVMADLYEVTLTSDGEGILVDGRRRSIPTGSYEHYVRLSQETTNKESAKRMLSIAKWIADKKSAYHQAALDEAEYVKNLPETVRRLEAKVEELEQKIENMFGDGK